MSCLIKIAEGTPINVLARAIDPLPPQPTYALPSCQTYLREEALGYENRTCQLMHIQHVLNGNEVNMPPPLLQLQTQSNSVMERLGGPPPLRIQRSVIDRQSEPRQRAPAHAVVGIDIFQ